MTIEELNKLIKEELDAFFEAEDEEVEDMEAPEGDDDDIEVTTDEPAAGTGEEAMDLLRQIYDMIKPEIEGEEEPEMDMEEPEEEEGEESEEEGGEEEVEEAVGYSNYKADDVQNVKANADDVNKSLNESVARFQKLANIKG